MVKKDDIGASGSKVYSGNKISCEAVISCVLCRLQKFSITRVTETISSELNIQSLKEGWNEYTRLLSFQH